MNTSAPTLTAATPITLATGLRGTAMRLRGAAAGLAVIAAVGVTAACTPQSTEPSAVEAPSATPSATPRATSSPAPSVAQLDPNAPLEDQLYNALRAGDVALAAALLDAGADVNAKLGQGSPAIFIAAGRGDPLLVEAVLAAGPDLTARDSTGWALLNRACRQDAGGEVIEPLLAAGAATLEVSGDAVGSYAIHECAYVGDQVAIEAFLAHGVDVNQRQADYQATPLIMAAWRGHTALVQYLLANGADPALTGRDNSTARDWALQENHTEVAAILEAAGG